MHRLDDIAQLKVIKFLRRFFLFLILLSDVAPDEFLFTLKSKEMT